MPKMKTKKAVLKRFKMTAEGKLKFKKSGLRHKLTHRDADSKRHCRVADYAKNGDMKRLLPCLPYHQ